MLGSLIAWSLASSSILLMTSTILASCASAKGRIQVVLGLQAAVRHDAQVVARLDVDGGTAQVHTVLRPLALHVGEVALDGHSRKAKLLHQR